VPASLVFALIAASIAFVAAAHAPHSTDLFWQIPEGRAVLRGAIPRDVPWALGAPHWTDHEWLFEALAAWCFDHGAFAALMLVCAAAAAAAPLLAYAAARDLRYDWASTSFAVLLVAASTAVSWSERPQNFVLLAFLAQLWLLWRGARLPLLMLPLACVWSNLHASGILAPFVCVAFAAGYAIEGGVADGRVRRALGGAAAAFAGTLLTPNGPALWAYALGSIGDANHSHRAIAEWLPLFDGDVLKPAIIWLLVVAALLAGTIFRRRDGFAAAATGSGFLVLPVLHARFILFAAAAAVPLVVRSIGAIVERGTAEREPAWPRAALAFPVVALAAGAWIAATSPPLGADRAYADARDLLVRNHVAGRIYAEYTADAYLAAFSALPVTVMIDAHGDPYDASVWDDEVILEHALPRWEEALRRRAIATVVLPATHPLVAALTTSPRWTVLDRTAAVRLFVARR
jgi:hypothetical protein